MMRPYFIFSIKDSPQLIFFLLLLPSWNWTRLEMRGGADSNCGPRGGASVKKLLIFVFWNICDSYLCGQLCFAFFVIFHFMENIETNNFWRFGQSYFPHFFLKNDKEIFFTCWLLMIMMMSIEKALIVTLIMRIVAAMMVILKRPLCSRPLMTLTKRHNPLEVNR